MSKLLVKLTFGLTAAATVGFYYLAAAPPTLAEAADVCGEGNFSDVCRPLEGAQPTIPTIYKNSTTDEKKATVPEPSTVIALLVSGAGIIFSGKKRKNIGEEP
jgi:hypothetical protein